MVFHMEALLDRLEGDPDLAREVADLFFSDISIRHAGTIFARVAAPAYRDHVAARIDNR